MTLSEEKQDRYNNFACAAEKNSNLLELNEKFHILGRTQNKAKTVNKGYFYNVLRSPEQYRNVRRKTVQLHNVKNMHLHRDSNPGPWNTVPML